MCRKKLLQVLQCVAVCCSVLQCVAVSPYFWIEFRLPASDHNTLQHTATHCNTLQQPRTHWNTLHHTAIYIVLSFGIYYNFFQNKL